MYQLHPTERYIITAETATFEISNESISSEGTLGNSQGNVRVCPARNENLRSHCLSIVIHTKLNVRPFTEKHTFK